MQSFKSIQRRNARRRKEMLCSAIVMTIGLGIYLQRAKKSAAAGQRQVRSPSIQFGSEERGQIVIWCTRWREKSKPGSRQARQVKRHRSLKPCPGIYRKPVRVGESRGQVEVERQRAGRNGTWICPTFRVTAPTPSHVIPAVVRRRGARSGVPRPDRIRLALHHHSPPSAQAPSHAHRRRAERLRKRTRS